MELSLKKRADHIVFWSITIFIIIIFIYFFYSCLGGSGANLARYQHSSDKSPDKKTHSWADANFRANNAYYYVVKGKVYTHERDLIVELTQNNTEGYFVYEDKLYYAYKYGKERQIRIPTIAGPVGYNFIKYRYGKLDISCLTDKRISRIEYRMRYWKVHDYINKANNSPY
ncbi:hypothetical protein [Desulfitibacter alkalitolerans]|uniref:hypothetical protein n=1 Tax=Desulfitibacter alkalitolerans TaxID=264641 RepID=UPI0004893391|nr:hypothetical protein [Desulfitibacter alkalitolerans]